MKVLNNTRYTTTGLESKTYVVACMLQASFVLLDHSEHYYGKFPALPENLYQPTTTPSFPFPRFPQKA